MTVFSISIDRSKYYTAIFSLNLLLLILAIGFVSRDLTHLKETTIATEYALLGTAHKKNYISFCDWIVYFINDLITAGIFLGVGAEKLLDGSIGRVNSGDCRGILIKMNPLRNHP
jgi:hypothetical protein